MQVKILSAEGPVLDYLVSAALGYELEAPAGPAGLLWMVKKSDGQTTERQAFLIWPDDHTHRYSEDWACGGWLVDNHILDLGRDGDEWSALAGRADGSLQRADGPTALIAVARCVAASRLGEWAHVPDCLAPPPEAGGGK